MQYNVQSMIPVKVVLVCVLLWWLTINRLEHHKPTPLPASIPASLFSEERAMKHTSHIAATFPERQIGTVGAKAAAKYIHSHCRNLQDTARSHRHDLDVKVYLMNDMHGAFPCEFSGVKFTSVYNGLINVVLSITPRHAANVPGVLINAHFDNSQGTVGASDCASCVGVALEVASVLVHNSSARLAAPVVFLWNGGEETLFQGAHAFMQNDRQYALPTLGAFINLESTGPGGYDTLIQHHGGWTAEAFARAAPYPRGSVWSQDQLDLHVIPGTTDYVIFSQHMPGVDIAFMEDASAYHTWQDTVDRMQPGWLQSMGLNTLALAAEFTSLLSANATSQLSNRTPLQSSKVVFFDVFGFKMFTLSQRKIEQLRIVPLVLAVTLPALHNTGGKQGCYAAMLGCFLRSLASLFGALALGAGMMGAARAELSGNPMAWFGSPVLICLTILPAAIAGCLLPYLDALPPCYASYMRGYTLLAAALAYAGAAVGIGGSIFFTLAAAGSSFLQLLDSKGSFSSMRSFWIATLLNTGPVAVSVAACGFGIRHVLQKVNFVGHAPWPFFTAAQDLGVGILLSLPLFFHVALMLPFVAYNLSVRSKVLLVGLLFSVSLATGTYVSLTRSPYSAQHPKRIWVQHLHEHVDSVDNDRFVLGSWDNISPVVALTNGPRFDTTTAELNGREWLSVPFLRKFFLTSAIRAPPVPNAYNISSMLERLNHIDIGSKKRRSQYRLLLPSGTSSAALIFRLDPQLANITEWNITGSQPVAVPARHGLAEYPIWLTGLQEVPQYDFQLDLEVHEQQYGLNAVHLGDVEVSVSTSAADNENLRSLLSELPTWTSTVAYNTFQTVMPLLDSPYRDMEGNSS